MLVSDLGGIEFLSATISITRRGSKSKNYSMIILLVTFMAVKAQTPYPDCLSSLFSVILSFFSCFLEAPSLGGW